MLTKFALKICESIFKVVKKNAQLLLIHERETRNEGVLQLYGILLAVMTCVMC